jgi:hypothetical protein
MRLRTANNKCLDIEYGEVSPNRVNYVIIWTCHSGDNQKWFYDRHQHLTSYMEPNYCVTVRTDLLDSQGAPRLTMQYCGDPGNIPYDSVEHKKQRWTAG